MLNDRRARYLYKLFADGGAAGTQYNLGISNERGRDPGQCEECNP
jgi:hypothetical protein